MQICKEIKKCKKHKNYKKMNLKFGRRYRSSSNWLLVLLIKINFSYSRLWQILIIWDYDGRAKLDHYSQIRHPVQWCFHEVLWGTHEVSLSFHEVLSELHSSALILLQWVSESVSQWRTYPRENRVVETLSNRFGYSEHEQNRSADWLVTSRLAVRPTILRPNLRRIFDHVVSRARVLI